jgi:hypothetical protein
LHTLATAGVEPIDPRIFTRATFENGHDIVRAGRTSNYYKELKALDGAFPFTSVVREIRELRADRKKDADTVVREYAANLARRAAIYKSRPGKLGSLAVDYLKPGYTGKHRKK